MTLNKDTEDELKTLYRRIWRRGRMEAGSINAYEVWSEEQIMAALHRLILKERRAEVESFGSKDTVHPQFCKTRGDQFKECLQCLKDQRIAQIDSELERSSDGD